LDQNINVFDVILIVSDILGISEFNEGQMCAGDLNSDQTIDLLDNVMLINQILNN